ncbi:MAG: hypothetical protein RBT34_11305, partial [Anaerolineaceae bacterium]|nr:hypothetical protein [Anaerolineaceae bacterium]
VQRKRAEMYLLAMLVCFGLSVALTRLFLELSGYPQLGNSELHIAHVLWGGLLLFAGVLVLLMFANPWAAYMGAVLGGVGMGLFMDEVGKFITQNNDYFYPWAAPIIYAFFLLTVIIYLRVNRNQPDDPRSAMYHALDLLSEVLDHDLEAAEKAELIGHLQAAQAEEENEDLVVLSQTLLTYIERVELQLAPDRPDFWQRWEVRLKHWEESHFNRMRLKWGLLLGLGLLAAISFGELAVVARVQYVPDVLSEILIDLMLGGQVRGVRGVRWFTAFTALSGGIGLLYAVSIVLSVLGKERAGFNYAYAGLLLELTGANLLAFYFNQFSMIFLALVQLILLIAVMRYQRRFLT